MGIEEINYQEVKKMRNQGMVIKDIAKHYTVRVEVISKYLKLKGLPCMSGVPGKISYEEVARMSKEGMKSVEIAEHFGVSQSYITNIRKKIGYRNKEKIIEKADKARDLQKKGLSYPKIAKELGMSVGWVAKNLSRSTLIDPEDAKIGKINLDRYPEAPDLEKYFDHWSVLLARRVIYQAMLDLYSGERLHQEQAVEFFKSGNFLMWAWLTGKPPEDVYRLAVKINRREIEPPGGSAPKNFGILLD